MQFRLGTIASLAYLTLMVTGVVLAQNSPQGQYSTSQQIYQGCYSSSGNLKDQGTFQFQSSGHCQETCGRQQNLPVMGLQKGSNCWCGDALPANSTKVSDGECNTTCQGFPKEMCGGENVWTVYLTGTQSQFSTIASSDGTSSTVAASGQSTQNSGGSPTNSQSPSVITKAGETIVVTASGQSTGSSKSGSGPSKVGIAVGIVAGVIGLAALAGAGYFFYRQKKRRSVEEEYRRSAAINNFVAPSKAKSEASGSLSDSRLDPSIMAHRRMSDGSIADERDFSRRILHVTNPDGDPREH